MTFFGEFLIESCNRQVSQKIRGVLPRFSVASPLLAQNVMDRFVYGMTVGTVSARTGIGKGTLFSECARLSEILKADWGFGLDDSKAHLSHCFRYWEFWSFGGLEIQTRSPKLRNSPQRRQYRKPTPPASP